MSEGEVSLSLTTTQRDALVALVKSRVTALEDSGFTVESRSVWGRIVEALDPAVREKREGTDDLRNYLRAFDVDLLRKAYVSVAPWGDYYAVSGMTKESVIDLVCELPTDEATAVYLRAQELFYERSVSVRKPVPDTSVDDRSKEESASKLSNATAFNGSPSLPRNVKRNRVGKVTRVVKVDVETDPQAFKKSETETMKNAERKIERRTEVTTERQCAFTVDAETIAQCVFMKAEGKERCEIAGALARPEWQVGKMLTNCGPYVAALKKAGTPVEVNDAKARVLSRIKESCGAKIDFPAGE